MNRFRINRPRLDGRVGIASVVAMALVVGALQAVPAIASGDEELGSEAASVAAVSVLSVADAGLVDDAGLSQTESGIESLGEDLVIEGTSLEAGAMQIGLPTTASLALTDEGTAASVDPTTGLGVVIAAMEGGGARILTVADENFSEEPEHEYEYDLTLPDDVDVRQLTTGEIVLVASAPDNWGQDAFQLPADVDPQEYAEGLAESSEGMGPESDPALREGELVVGGFMEPWSIDARGTPLNTHYELRGDTLVQVVDTEGAVFPVVSDPAPLIVIGLLVAARVFVAASMRAFATTTIRAGVTMTTRGGKPSFAQFKSWAGNAKPNYQWHHIVEQGNSKFPALAIHNPQNLVQIPTAIHQKCVNSWMAKKFAGSVAGFAFKSSLTVRDQVRAMSWQNQHKFGVQLLRYCGIDL